MKKKVLSALLATAMVATMFAGCGSKADDAATTTDDAAATTDDAAAGDDAAAEDAPAEEYISNEQASTSLGDLLSKFKL